MLSRQMLRITALARALVLLAMAAPILWGHDAPALLALIGVACIWIIAQVSAQIPRLSRWAEPTVEAAGIGVLAGVAMHASLAILAATCLPPFVAGLRRGLGGVVLSTCTQLVAVLLAGLFLGRGIDADQSLNVFTWVVAGVGLGLIATFVRVTIMAAPDELQPYLEAQALIRELIDISGGLKSGLDVTSLAGLTVSSVRDSLPTDALALYVPRGELLVPLVTKTIQSTGGDLVLAEVEPVALEVWARTEPIVHGLTFAFPVGDRAVVGGTVSPSAGLTRESVEAVIADLVIQLRTTAVQLDTALLFSDFRDSATADVRKRLAREMHDGIAQDIASLGYLVDALAAKPATPKQGEQFAMLRTRITAIVAEVRQSVLTLRTSIGESESLGAAIGAVARHLSESSQIPIAVTLDEQASRLRPEVEAELFRITQEAMNNAIKHAKCSAIEVSCQVYAPDALIVVTDDGVGLQKGRSDSHGLKIMRERARLVNADLTIGDRPSGGLCVAVQISASGLIPPFSPDTNADRVTT